MSSQSRAEAIIIICNINELTLVIFLKRLTWSYFQVRKLELDILPLQEANAELSEKSGMLQAEKKLLEEDVKRWKARNQVSTASHLLS